MLLSRVCKAAKSALCCLRAVKVRCPHGKEGGRGARRAPLHQLRGPGSGDVLAALGLLLGPSLSCELGAARGGDGNRRSLLLFCLLAAKYWGPITHNLGSK